MRDRSLPLRVEASTTARRSRRRELVAQLALVLLAAFLSLALAEGLLRVAYPLGAVLTEPDPRALFRLRAGGRKIHVEPGAAGSRTWVKINRDGFRGPPLLTQRHGEHGEPIPRILVYGDSFVLGAFSPQPATLGGRLEARLEEALGDDVEVVNAGVAGYGPDQALARLEDELPILRPDLVVFSVFSGNDFGDLIRNKMFRISEGQLEERPHPVHPDLARSMERSQHRLLLGTLVRGVVAGRRPSKEPAPLGLRMAHWRSLHVAELNDYFKDDTVRRLFEDRVDIQMASAPGAVPSRLKQELMTAVLARAHRSATEAGARLVFLFIPGALDVCAAPNGRVVPPVPGYDESHLSDALRDVGARLDVLGGQWVDLEPTFRQADPCALYFAGDTAHWNEAGQDLAADVLSRRILAAGWLNPES